ncbi:MAG: hypothetical protein Kow0092_12640 [Deferrisomatales bacterium]
MADAKKRKGRVLRILGYAVVALAAYVVSVVWFFPYPELSRRVERRARAQGIALEIKDLGPGWLPGLLARRVRAARLDHPDAAVEVEEVRLRLVPVRWLRGERTLRVQGRTFGGAVDVRFTPGDRSTVQAAWDRLDLARLPVHSALAELPLAGRASGTLDLQLESRRVEQLTGRLAATFTDLKIEAGTVQGFPVPPVSLGDGLARAVSRDGKVDVQTLKFQGGDLEVDFKGNILLRNDLSRSLISGLLSLRPDEKAAKELGLLFAMFPSSRSSDGRYTAKIRGSLTRPRLSKR